MHTYLYVLSYLKPYKGFMLVYVICTLLYIVFSIANLTIIIPLLNFLFDQGGHIPEELPEFGITVDYFLSLFNYFLNTVIEAHGRWGALQFICATFFFSTLLASAFRYLASISFTSASIRAIQRLRSCLFEKIIHLPIRFFSSQKRGDTISRLANDVREIDILISSTCNTLIKDPIMIMGHLFIIFSISWQLSLITLVTLPVLILIIVLIIKRLRRKSHEHQGSLSLMTSIIEESLQGISIVKSFTAERYVINKFNSEIRRYIRLYLSIVRRTDSIPGVSDVFGALTISLLLIMGGYFILEQKNSSTTMSASELIAFLIIITQVFSRAKSILSALGNLQKGIAAGDRIRSILNISETLKEEPSALSISRFSQNIEFKNVDFAYEELIVLEDISLSIEKNKVLALVGPSGAGKSTLSSLIPRFYDPTQGRILLDGEPMTSYKIRDLRQLIGIVPQEIVLFNDTILENIAFGKPGASLLEIEKAARIANAHEFIMEQPLQYQTVIGDSGIRLSGGQRQRINIARAVLKDPPILILDEATSSLDSASEQQVQEALQQVMQQRTCIVIAHRLSTVQHADEIVVMDKGHIIARGTHHFLLKANTLYKKLIDLQSFH